ncbi:MAG: NAD(P)/FAD-dependent oxidoreductase [Nitrospirota bacterium]|nr:MAG: NAD(P)/FAD-dependent oxidoreductase [Nitrospirota bacterium]
MSPYGKDLAMKIHDVIVIGAGPAGSAMATHLAQEGYSVLLLEKGVFPRDKVCGDFVSPKGLFYLEKLGCYEEIAQRGYTPIQRVSVHLNGSQLYEGALPRLPSYLPFAHAIPRNELDEILFRRAQKAGAVTIEGCQVLGFHTTPRMVNVEAQEGRRKRRFVGRVIVGADGANSVVARFADLAMNDARYIFPSIRGYCRGLASTEAILFVDEDFFPGFGWIFPVRGDLSNVGVGMVKETLSKHHISVKDFFKKFEIFVKSLAKRTGKAVEIEAPKGWAIKSYGGARQNYFERGLLIGEAACFVDPISGEGIPLALESAELGFETLQMAFDRGDFSVNTLSTYERRWRERWDPDLKVSDLVVSLIRNRYLLKFWIQSFRVMGMTALRDENYALKIGGIMAGLVPNREGFSPDIVLKSLLHGPSFWMEAFNIGKHDTVLDTLRCGVDWFNWELDVFRHLVSDYEWFQAWASEVNEKQSDLYQLLSNIPPRSTQI